MAFDLPLKALILSFSLVQVASAQLLPALGDIDNDGVATVRDIAIIAGHFNGTAALTDVQKQIADVNKDGAVNSSDMDELVKEILGTRTPETLPLSTVRFTSPSSGEANVAVTRETVVHFTVPLSPTATLDTTKFQAEFGGKKILSRVEISSDRKKATLFYLEPLPSNARIRVSLDTNGVTDLLNRPLDGDGDGQPGGFRRFNFDTLSITPVGGTAIVGRVIASERGTGGIEKPLSGVTITVDGAEETLRAVTDAQGNFTLSPCPAGTFFVKIDGRTSPNSSWPGGDYYPFVGKKWHAFAGRMDNLAGDEGDSTRGTIYLPCVCSGSLQSTSVSRDTAVQFPAATLAVNPALAGTMLVVPANSLFSDDGTRGGKIGMAPVAPDRLPSPLPEGLNPPLVITIQTDGGTNLDRPVAVIFPNLPDPVTGEILPPGEKSALWSFNHDTGEWELSGPMTVTADGNFLQSDPGTGVRQPGWHAPAPGTGGNGGTEDPEDPPEAPLDITTEGADREQPGPPGQPGGQEEGPVMQEGDNLNIVSNKPGVEWNVTAPPGSVSTSPGTANIGIVAVGGSKTIGDVTITGTYPGKNGPETDTIKITIVPKLQIAVDRNRDGVVSFDVDDETSPSSKHVFWVNSDSDNGGIQKVNDLKIGDLGYVRGDIDRAPSTIQGLGDLEDFDRLVMKGNAIFPQLLNRGYEIRLVESGIKVPLKKLGLSMTAREDSTLGYLLTNPSLAEEQANKILTPTSDIATYATKPRSAQISRFGDSEITFLFEGREADEYAIRFELIKKGGTIPTAVSNDIHLDIRPIEQFYDIYSPASKSGGNCDDITTPYYNIDENYVRVSASLPEWTQRKDNEYLLFVHGWRMKPENRRFFTETAFKRLFWLGYRGRVGLFSWPTDWISDYTISPLIYPKNYDRSERRAYHSSPALLSLLRHLKSQYSRNVVLAHSMGNIVVSEALRTSAIAGTKVTDTYIASQGAVSAGAFSTTAAEFGVEDIGNEKLLGLGALPDRDETQPDFYGSYPTAGNQPYFYRIGNSADRMINLFNPDDYALEYWMVNQLTKPDRFELSTDTPSIFGGEWLWSSISQKFYRREFRTFPPSNPLTGPDQEFEDFELDRTVDRYEIFSHVAESRYRPMGAVVIKLPSISVSNIQLNEFMAGEFDHSGQFNRPLIYTQNYWREYILKELQR
ncbi:alpha/beta hydrolase [Akkermansiaceae bacterium]|nr:alpha/beta hydrolase [Akkermansiaceae bacterium]